MQCIIVRFSACLSVCLAGAAVGSLTANAQQIDRIPIGRIQTASTAPAPPGGILAPRLGVYLEIEGIPYDGNGKVESNSMVIETVNGKRLAKPLIMRIESCRLPRATRVKLRGYEQGRMIGRPPAEYAAAKEIGRDPTELSNRDAVGWQWRTHFVPLIAVDPPNLPITTTWGFSGP